MKNVKRDEKDLLSLTIIFSVVLMILKNGKMSKYDLLYYIFNAEFNIKYHDILYAADRIMYIYLNAFTYVVLKNKTADLIFHQGCRFNNLF